MFTGIITDVGQVVDSVRDGEALKLSVRSPLVADCEIGASVALNGVCLTVVALDGDTATFDLSAETQERTTLGDLATGYKVNVERPMRAGQEFGGHIVQGHVDGVGVIESIVPEADGRRMRIALPEELSRYVVEKGSVCVDGVSLTATSVNGRAFEIALVPHTLAATTLGEGGPGTKVNIEVDVLAKYVEKLTSAGPRSAAREAS
jgi:riboflavin synthase